MYMHRSIIILFLYSVTYTRVNLLINYKYRHIMNRNDN